jgi:DNA polymerase III sliding clamp (beta) subunit (PCNA family)
MKDFKTVVDKGKPVYKVSVEAVPLDDADAGKSKKSKKPAPVVVQNDGKITVSFSKENGSDTHLKHDVNTFPTTDFETVKFSESPVTMKGKAELLSSPVKTVAFAVDTGDANEVYNHVGIADGGDKLYFFGSNGRRCAVVSSGKGSFDLATPRRTILLDLNLFTPVMDMLSGETVSVIEESDDMHVTFLADNTWVRIMGIDNAKREKYPDFNKIMTKAVESSILIDRDSVEEVLNHVSAANKERSRYEIKVGADHIPVSSKGVAHLSASSGWIKCDKIEKGLADETICLSTSYFMGAVGKLTGEKIRLAFTSDSRIARLESETNPEFTYLMQRMKEGS